MTKYQYLFFDLDGTIIDSSIGVCTCFAYALKAYGIEVSDLSELRPVLGPPLKYAFENFYGFSEEDSEAAVAKYRERYADVGIYECTVYEGIEKLFNKLNSAGYKLVLATSKPVIYAQKILEHFNLDSYFYNISGADFSRGISDKDEVLGDIISKLKLQDMSKVLMIGDRKYDLIGAEKFGIDALGVLYGFGDLEELSSYPNVGIAATVEDIGEFLI